MKLAYFLCLSDLSSLLIFLKKIMSTEKFIDCRSDTVTLPSPEMKQAMMEAPLGDDVFGDDPTVKKLEKYMADKFGKQAGLFFPTGTMSNLCALMAHTNRGEAILTGDLNHIVFWEQGGLSQIGNIPSFQLETLPDSTFDLVKLKQKLDTFAPIGKNGVWVDDLSLIFFVFFVFLQGSVKKCTKNRKKKITKKFKKFKIYPKIKCLQNHRRKPCPCLSSPIE